MWRYVAESVAGSRHEADGTPCQDACGAVLLETSEGPGLLLAVADGAGSARASEVGARTAVRSIVECGAESPTNARFNPERLAGWYHQAAAAVAEAAKLQGLPPRDLACTLLMALVLPQRSLFAQVGDGVIVASGEDAAYRPVHWPADGDSPNETTFLTCPDWRDALRVTAEDRAITEVALLSDGLQYLALDYLRRAAHRPFFQPLFEALRRTHQGDLAVPLRAFLDSERVSSRTDDDRTLVLATRSFASA